MDRVPRRKHLGVPNIEPQPLLRVLCVAPAWNEGERISRAVRSVPLDIMTTVLVVDDGSTDGTATSAEQAGAAVLRHKMNRGVGAAIRSGIDFGLANGYDVVAVISGGGKTPAEQIPGLLGPILSGEAEMVQGSRYLRGGVAQHMPWHRRFGTRAYSALFSLLAGARVTDASSGFRAMRVTLFADRRINLWQPWLDRYELEPYLLFQALRFGHKVKEVPVTIAYPPKAQGSGRNYTKMRGVFDWWRIFRPVLFLALRLKR
ncbi:MAG: glycosyltransferase family 2 protein [Pseudomonadota bacterium]